MKVKPSKRTTKAELILELNALQLIENEYRLLLDESSDPIFAFYPDGRYRYVNQAFANGTGLERIDIIGKKIWDIFARDEADKRFAAVKWVFEHGQTKILEVRVPRPNQDRFYITTVKPIFGSGEAVDSVICISKDITDRKKAEEEKNTLELQFQQSQKLESLGILAGGIAHDFNNILQTLLGNIEIAARDIAPDSDTYTHISNAIISGRQATHLINLMLAYAGKGTIVKRQLNLNEILNVNIDILRSAATTAVTIEMCLSDQLPAIFADHSQIQQVVLNLITNAAESIEHQPGNIRLSTGVMNCDQSFLSNSLLKEKPEPGEYVFLEVSDNGCGMEAETLKRIFEPFFTTKFTGRGLGMSAVMGIVQSHGGALYVESLPGKGTTFKVLIPPFGSLLPSTAQPGIADDVQRTSASTTPVYTVLLVDDEKNVLRTCSKMVSLCGYNVITACDGIEAVNKYREHANDICCVLMDLTMPNMNGISAMKEIRSINPKAKVLLASGFNKEELSSQFAEQAPAGFIRKPYGMLDLEEELQRILQYS